MLNFLTVSTSRATRSGRLRLGAPAALGACLSAACLAGCGASVPSGRPQAIPPAATVPAAAPGGATTGSAGRVVRYARVSLRVPAANGGFGRTERLDLPSGSSAEVWALVGGARLEAWTPEGDLLVSQPAAGTVTELVPRAQRSAPPAHRTLLSGLTNPQGMAFDKLGGQEVLYVAESDGLDRYVWRGAGVGARTVLVHDLPDTQPPGDDVHRMKNVVVGADHTVYVDVGSSSNAGSPASADGLPRASVLAYRPTGRLLRVFATGIRNGDGLSFAPDGTLWAAVNERDNIAYPFHGAYGGHADAFGHVITSYVDDHPPDEVARLTPGRNLGWPFCDPDPDVDPGKAGSRLDYANMPYDRDAQTNAGGSQLDCARLPRIQRGLPAHSAPLGFHFLAGSSLPAQWRAGAVVATHGSWDRSQPRPPGVLWMPWNARTRTLGTAIPLVTGFQLSGGRWGRTVDAVPGPDGALYVSDDTAGAVYRIVLATG